MDLQQNPLSETQILQSHFMFLSFYKKSEPKIFIMLCISVCLGHTPSSIIDINFICRVTTSVYQEKFTKLYLKFRSCQERERSLVEYETKEGRLWLVKSRLSDYENLVVSLVTNCMLFLSVCFLCKLS